VLRGAESSARGGEGTPTVQRIPALASLVFISPALVHSLRPLRPDQLGGRFSPSPSSRIRLLGPKIATARAERTQADISEADGFYTWKFSEPTVFRSSALGGPAAGYSLSTLQDGLKLL